MNAELQSIDYTFGPLLNRMDDLMVYWLVSVCTRSGDCIFKTCLVASLSILQDKFSYALCFVALIHISNHSILDQLVF